MTRLHGMVMSDDEIIGLWEAFRISDVDTEDNVTLSCQYAEPGHVVGPFTVKVHGDASIPAVLSALLAGMGPR